MSHPLNPITAIRLLHAWGPTDPGTGRPVFRVESAQADGPAPEEYPSGSDDAAENIGRLLTEALTSGLGTLGDPARELVTALAANLADEYGELERVPSDRGLRLFGRDFVGRTLELSIVPAGQEQERHDSAGGLLTRARDAGELLGDLAMVTNNDPTQINIYVEPHGLDLSAESDAVDTAVRQWWESFVHSDELEAEEWWNTEDPRPHRLDDAAFAEFLADFESYTVQAARTTAWVYADEDDEDEDADEVSDDNSQREHAWESLARLLGRDLFATVAAAVTADDAPRAYGIGIPFGMSDDDYGPCGVLLLIGPESAGVVTIDAAA